MSQAAIGVDPTKTFLSTDTPGFGLGDTLGYDDTIEGYKEYVFGQAEAVLQAVGNVLIEGAAGVWSRITTANTAPGQAGGHGTRVGVAAGAIPASGFGWFQVYGRCAALTAGAVAIGTRLNSTATAGAIDDDGTVGARPILGAVFKTAVAGAQVGADCRLSYPSIGLTI